MIPEFPKFKRIEIADKERIKSFTEGDRPYSDFDFTSLWMWDTHEVRGWAELDGNLVVRFTDYLDGQVFYSFFGHNRIEKNIKILMNFISSEGLSPTLRLVPESVVSGISRSRDIVRIEEDEDNFDYVYAIQNLITYPGYDYSQQRKMMNRFVKRNQNVSVKTIDLKHDQLKIKELIARWEQKKTFDKYDEKEAFERGMLAPDNFSFINVGIFVNDDLVGFTVNEITDEEFAISHFAKANIEYDGIYSYMMRETANVLAMRGCSFLNCEQDLGIPGLRQAKGSYRPEFFLKKYTLQY